MLYYRRKPLEVLPVDVLAVEAARLATEVANPIAPGGPGHATMPASAIDDIASVLPLQPRPESGLLKVDPSAAPTTASALPHAASVLSPDRSGADLVTRAVEILNRDLAAGALAAASATPFHSALPTLDNGSFPMANGLPGSMGEAVNSLLQAATQRQSPVGNGLFPAVAPIGMPWGGDTISAAEETVPLRPARTVRAGERTTIGFKLHNDSFRPVQISLQIKDLTSPTGQRIPQSEITVTPQEISLAPDGTAEIVITIRVPAATPPGTYSGPLTAAALPYLHGVLMVTVD